MRYYILGIIIPIGIAVIIGIVNRIHSTDAPAAIPARMVCFEAESGNRPIGHTYRIMSLRGNMESASGGKVVVILPDTQGGHVSKSALTYHLTLTEANTYYLWARVYWTTGCGNSLLVSFDTTTKRRLVLGGDDRYNTFHWVTPSDLGSTEQCPLPLHLDKGAITFTVSSNESGIMIDQFILTTDRRLYPVGMYPPTPDWQRGYRQRVRTPGEVSPDTMALSPRSAASRIASIRAPSHSVHFVALADSYAKLRKGVPHTISPAQSIR